MLETTTDNGFSSTRSLKHLNGEHGTTSIPSGIKLETTGLSTTHPKTSSTAVEEINSENIHSTTTPGNNREKATTYKLVSEILPEVTELGSRQLIESTTTPADGQISSFSTKTGDKNGETIYIPETTNKFETVHEKSKMGPLRTTPIFTAEVKTLSTGSPTKTADFHSHTIEEVVTTTPEPLIKYTIEESINQSSVVTTTPVKKSTMNIKEETSQKKITVLQNTLNTEIPRNVEKLTTSTIETLFTSNTSNTNKLINEHKPTTEASTYKKDESTNYKEKTELTTPNFSAKGTVEKIGNLNIGNTSTPNSSINRSTTPKSPASSSLKNKLEEKSEQISSGQPLAYMTTVNQNLLSDKTTTEASIRWTEEAKGSTKNNGASNVLTTTIVPVKNESFVPLLTSVAPNLANYHKTLTTLFTPNTSIKELVTQTFTTQTINQKINRTSSTPSPFNLSNSTTNPETKKTDLPEESLKTTLAKRTEFNRQTYPPSPTELMVGTSLYSKTSASTRQTPHLMPQMSTKSTGSSQTISTTFMTSTPSYLTMTALPPSFLETCKIPVAKCSPTNTSACHSFASCESSSGICVCDQGKIIHCKQN